MPVVRQRKITVSGVSSFPGNKQIRAFVRDMEKKEESRKRPRTRGGGVARDSGRPRSKFPMCGFSKISKWNSSKPNEDDDDLRFDSDRTISNATQPPLKQKGRPEAKRVCRKGKEKQLEMDNSSEESVSKEPSDTGSAIAVKVRQFFARTWTKSVRHTGSCMMIGFGLVNQFLLSCFVREEYDDGEDKVKSSLPKETSLKACQQEFFISFCIVFLFPSLKSSLPKETNLKAYQQEFFISFCIVILFPSFLADVNCQYNKIFDPKFTWGTICSAYFSGY